MADRIISVSGAPYDGHNRERMLESVAGLGVGYFEPAFIVGYTEPFDETAFGNAQALGWRKALEAAGLLCHAMSSHIDLGLDNAGTFFAGRMEFASALGAKVIATNAAARSREGRFIRNIDGLLRRAEALDLIIALENPGDGSDNLINDARDGIALVKRLGSPHLRLNYDAANTASHRPGLADFAGDAVSALPWSAHAHIKDVVWTEQGWFFAPIGQGIVGCVRLLEAIAAIPDFPISVELPLRLHRDPSAKPARRADPVSVQEIEEALARSLRVVNEALGATERQGRRTASCNAS